MALVKGDGLPHGFSVGRTVHLTSTGLLWYFGSLFRAATTATAATAALHDHLPMYLFKL